MPALTSRYSGGRLSQFIHGGFPTILIEFTGKEWSESVLDDPRPNSVFPFALQSTQHFVQFTMEVFYPDWQVPITALLQELLTRQPHCKRVLNCLRIFRDERRILPHFFRHQEKWWLHGCARNPCGC